MPLIFPPRSNTFAKVSIVGGLILLAAVTGFLVWFIHSPTFNKVGVAVDQPVPFPHGFHVAAVGLNCRYCHESVDKSSFAGMPNTETCMSCHSQVALNNPKLEPVRESWKNGTPIVWNRVNKIPDYAFFNHSIHINKGVGCETCHGNINNTLQTTAVKAQTFYMTFCLDCHENPAKYVRPRDQVYTQGYQPAGDQMQIGQQLVEEYKIQSPSVLTNCSTCHR